jgi:hypothetical protein
MVLSLKQIERKVIKLNKWLSNHPKTHFDYPLKEQNRNFYVGKLCQMDENNLTEIKI